MRRRAGSRHHACFLSGRQGGHVTAGVLSLPLRWRQAIAMTDDTIIDTILKYEGTYTNNLNDHGGPTNYGITAADYGRWRGKSAPATAEEVQAMDVATARIAS